MRRTTVLLDDDLADRLDYERRRRNQSTTAIVREALTEYLAGGKPRSKQLGFVGLGRSGYQDTAQNFEQILAQEWPAAILADSFSSAGPLARGKKRTAAKRRRR